MNQESKALAVGSRKALAELLSSEMRAFQSLLPEHITPERLARLALEAASRTPDILKCSRASIIKSMIDCATMGLEPVGKGGVHLVPWKNKDQYELNAITDYRGEITLAYRSGFTKDVHAESVHTGELFRYVAGDEPRIEHEPNLTIDRFEPKTLQLVYAVVRLNTGGRVRKVLNRKAIERYRDKSKAKNGPWDGDFVAMALKTVIRRAMNEVPQSSEYRDLVRNEEVREFGGPPPVIVDATAEDVTDASSILAEARS